MNKQLEQFVIVGVLGATAFVLWRAYRNGMSLGKLGNLTGANASSIISPYGLDSLSSAARSNIIRPTADNFIDSIYSGGGGGSASPSGTNVVLSNGTVYTAGSDAGYSNLY